MHAVDAGLEFDVAQVDFGDEIAQLEFQPDQRDLAQNSVVHVVEILLLIFVGNLDQYRCIDAFQW